MKMSLPLLATLGLGLSRALAADTVTPAPAVVPVPNKNLAPDDYLQQVLMTPGDYRQICSGTVISGNVPLPVYGQYVRRAFHLSDANLALLKAKRPEMIVALKKQLENSTAEALSDPLYESLVGIDAIETLPVLLRLEERLAAEVAKGSAQHRDWFHGSLSAEDSHYWNVLVAQREVLSVMLQLLRGQRYQPLLDSEFEKVYAAKIKDPASQEGMRDFKTPADAKAKNATWLRFDPIYHIPVSKSAPPPEMPFTPEVRAQVRGLAEQFLQTVPPEKWLVNSDNH
jgi:hypothetical protein